MVRLIVALVAGTTVFAAAYAAAAGLGLSASSLGAGSTAVAQCASQLPAVESEDFVLDGEDDVVAVKINGIPSACEGGELTLRLLDDVGSVLSGGTASVAFTVCGDGCVQVSLNQTLTATQAASVAEAAIIIVGPFPSLREGIRTGNERSL